MNKTVVKFESVEITDFLIDDDKEMKWISGFDADRFDRFFVFIDSNKCVLIGFNKHEIKALVIVNIFNPLYRKIKKPPCCHLQAPIEDDIQA